ncbi:hypothetical protein BDR04DRAFT_1006937 [Suillus decipiens]|nr:hypothetical protein BDR04DRAFT_1006937 [Suillus decipiens]
MRSEGNRCENSPFTAHSTIEHGIVTLYQIVHDAIHAKFGQTGTLKLQYTYSYREGNHDSHGLRKCLAVRCNLV